MSARTMRSNEVANQKPGMVFPESTLQLEIDPDMIRHPGSQPVAAS